MKWNHIGGAALVAAAMLAAGGFVEMPVQAAGGQTKVLIQGDSGTEPWLRENATDETYEKIVGRPKPGHDHAVRFSEAYKKADISAPELLEVERLIDGEREKAGLAPFTWDEDLMRMAAVKAGLNAKEDMDGNSGGQDTFWLGFDDSKGRKRLQAVEVRFADTPAMFMEWCRMQPSDWEALLRPGQMEAGIAHIQASGEMRTHYWVVLLRY